MKTKRFSTEQIIAILNKADGVMSFKELFRIGYERSDSVQVEGEVWKNSRQLRV
jgi:hypothetical protein